MLITPRNEPNRTNSKSKFKIDRFTQRARNQELRFGKRSWGLGRVSISRYIRLFQPNETLLSISFARISFSSSQSLVVCEDSSNRMRVERECILASLKVPKWKQTNGDVKKKKLSFWCIKTIIIDTIPKPTFWRAQQAIVIHQRKNKFPQSCSLIHTPALGPTDCRSFYFTTFL